LLAASLLAGAAQTTRIRHKDSHLSAAQRSIDPPNLPLIQIDPSPVVQIPVTGLNENGATLRSPDEATSDVGMSADDGGIGSDSGLPGCHLQTDMVLVRIEVKDQQGWYVFTLRRDDFIVYEDGNQRPIDYFTREITDPDAPWIGYTIGYYPLDSIRDGRPRKIRVRIRDGKSRGLNARCQPAVYRLETDDSH